MLLQNERKPHELTVQITWETTRANDSRVFSDYAVWLKGILNTYVMETRTLTDNFRYLQYSLSTVDELDEPTKRASAST